MMCFLPTFNTCGGSKPLSLKGSSELSLGSGTSQVTLAYGLPNSVVLSISDGHWILGGWTSVNKVVSNKTAKLKEDDNQNNWACNKRNRVYLE